MYVMSSSNGNDLANLFFRLKNLLMNYAAKKVMPVILKVSYNDAEPNLTSIQAR